MSISLDAVNARHLWHMQDIGRLWEQHVLKCGAPVNVSILVDVPSQDGIRGGSTVHVFPVAAVRDETFLGRALDAYTSRKRSQVLVHDIEGASDVDGGRSSPKGQDLPPSAEPTGALPVVPPLDASTVNPSDLLFRNLFDGAGAAAVPNDEFGLKRFVASWRQDRPIAYADVEHLCPRVPFLNDGDPVGGAEKPVVRLEDSAVNAFLDTVGKAGLENVTWEIVNGVTSCARYFIDKVSFNKPWYYIGPVEARTVSYVYSIAGVDQFSLPVAAVASKEGGVTLHKRALTVAALSARSPFWRMAVAAYSLFKPGRRQPRRVKQTGEAKKKRNQNAMATGGAAAKKARNGSGAGSVGAAASGSRSGSSLPASAAVLSEDQELRLWNDAPGLDVEDRPVSPADLAGRCSWFWKNRPQPGDRCLSLLSYKTLGDLYRLRGGRVSAAGSSGIFARLVNVPGDNDCFYHVIASGLFDRLAAFPGLPKSDFWQDVGVHPGLLRWGVAAYQRAMLGDGALSYLFPAWLSLTCPGQTFTHPSEGQAVLKKAIMECEGERSWMGVYHGEYAVLADILGAVIRVFSPIGCQPDSAPVDPPHDVNSGLFSLGDARVDIVGQEGHRRCVLRPGNGVVQVKPSCVHVPLHFVSQAAREALASESSADSEVVVHNRAKEIAVSRRCIVLGVIRNGSAHFMYPFVHPHLLTDYTGATLPAFNFTGSAGANTQ